MLHAEVLHPYCNILFAHVVHSNHMKSAESVPSFYFAIGSRLESTHIAHMVTGTSTRSYHVHSIRSAISAKSGTFTRQDGNDQGGTLVLL